MEKYIVSYEVSGDSELHSIKVLATSEADAIAQVQQTASKVHWACKTELSSQQKAYLSTKSAIANYAEISNGSTDADELANFPTLRDYCLYLCGSDFTAFDDYNTLANHIMQDDLHKGVPIC